MSIVRFNAKLRRAGIPLELVKGEGYLYFITDGITRHYASRSVYVCHFTHLTQEQWMDRATEAWEDMQANGDGEVIANNPTHH